MYLSEIFPSFYLERSPSKRLGVSPDTSVFIIYVIGEGEVDVASTVLLSTHLGPRRRRPSTLSSCHSVLPTPFQNEDSSVSYGSS